MIKILIFIFALTVYAVDKVEKVEKSETFKKAEKAEKAGKAKKASIVKKVAEIQNPSLSLTFGLPYMIVQENIPRYLNDFLSLGIGALMEFKIDETHSIGVIIDTTYTPKHNNFKFEKDSKEVEGTTSLLTSFYSLNYLSRLGRTDGYDIFGTLGPTIGIYTLNYTAIENNETEITKVNRVKVTNYGLRAGVKWRNRITFNFFEIATIYSISDKYTRINDSTNDAEAIEELENITQKQTIGILFNYGFYLF